MYAETPRNKNAAPNLVQNQNKREKKKKKQDDRCISTSKPLKSNQNIHLKIALTKNTETGKKKKKNTTNVILNSSMRASQNKNRAKAE
jgi:hypothetical protein